MSLLNFSDHLNALRKTLFQISLVVLLGFILTFSYSNEIIAYLSQPIKTNRSGIQATPIKVVEVHNYDSTPRFYRGEKIAPNETRRIEIKEEGLYLFSPAEGLIISLKISFWLGLLLTAPIWLVPLILFILPALYAHERKLLFPALFTLAIFLGAGILTALQVTLPLTNHYFIDYNQEIGTNLWGLENYIDYTLTLIIAHGVGFELIAILFLLVHYQLIDLDFLKTKRRHVIVLSLILGAILTPPDVLSQLAVAIPLYLGYELILVYGALRQKKLFYAHGN